MAQVTQQSSAAAQPVAARRTRPLFKAIGFLTPYLFLAPAIVLLAHAWLWRKRAAEVQTRMTLASGMLLLAAFVTLEVTRADGDADWLGAVVGALSFAAAIGVNFVPGLVRQRQVTSR